MADVNPLDALDEGSNAAPVGAGPTNPLDALDDQAGANPLDQLETPPASDRTASRMEEITDQAHMPQVTVSARSGPESSWSDVARGVPTAIGANIESKIGGTQEFIGRTKYDDARKRFWQATVLPQAVRDAQKQGVALTDLPEVKDAADHLGIRADTFTRDWPTYVNMSPQEISDLQSQQRDRIQIGGQQIASGSQKRLTAQQVSELYAPRMDSHSLKAVVFDAATMAPDLLAGYGATVATGGVGGAALMAADIAPSQYAAARNRGLNHNDASTYAILSTLATSVPEVPVFKVLEGTPAANKILESVVGQKLAATATGKVAGTTVAQGVTQSVVNALQQGVDAGVLNQSMPLDEALRQVAWSGLEGAVAGAPLGAAHAAQHRFSEQGQLEADLARTRRQYPDRQPQPMVGPYEPIGVRAGVSGFGAAPKPLTFQDIPETGEGAPANDMGTMPYGHETKPVQTAIPPEVNRAGTEKPEAPPPTSAGDEHAALLAMKERSITPPQVDLLEGLGLVKRNDLNEPMWLPAGRRRLVELEKAPVSETNTAAKEPEKAPEALEIEAKPPVSAPETEAPKPPEVVEKPAESTEIPAEVAQKAPQTLQDRIASDQDLREGLLAMKGETGWAQVGGRLLRDATTDEVTGRTSWIPNADWWPGRPKGMKEEEIHAAVDKAVAGQPLKRREQAMVEYMAQVHDERNAMAATQEELQAAVPELHKQPEGALELTLLASRAAEHDPNEAARVMDLWEDDKPETIARVRGGFEEIIGRGQKDAFTLSAQEGRGAEPAPVKRTPAALDLFGEDRTSQQALADEQRRRDALRSPNRDVSLETGLPGDLFSRSRQQVDFTDQLKQARAETHTEPTERQKVAGNYRKGRLNFSGGMEVAIENPKGSTRSGVGTDGKPWSRELQHDYGYFVGTKGADGDAVDTFLTGKPDTGKIFAINQVDPETGKFDEVKVVAGAETAQEAQEVYHANYPRGWKGLGSMAEMPTARFREWLDSGNTKKPVPGAQRVERREPGGARRAKVAEMTPEQLRAALLTHELTGIPNRRAYQEADKLPHQVSIDVDSLKWVNDEMGHESGNELLKAIASSLSSHSDNVFHLSGDEFAAQAHTETEAHELMREVSEHLKGASIEVEMPDGRVVKLKGLGVSYGVGKTLEEADAALSAHKARRQAEGARAARGEAPPGATVRAREEGRQDQAGGPAPEDVTVKEDAAQYSHGLLLQPSGGVEARARRSLEVAPGQGALELFVPEKNPVPGTRAATGLSRTQLVRTGHFATGIKRITRWQDAAHIIAPLRKQPQESLLAVVADANGDVLAVVRHTTGTSTQSHVEVPALLGAVSRVPGAKQVWFAHNHPSGDIEQSPNDHVVAERLQRLMTGSGIKTHGMIVVGAGDKRATYYGRETIGDEYRPITPAARRGEVPIQERRFQSVRPVGEGQRITTTTDAEQLVKRTVEKTGHDSGVLLFDAKLRNVGLIPMTPEEMSKLRTKDPQTGTAHVLAEIESANALSAIPYGEGGEKREALQNIGQMLKDAGVNVPDTIVKSPVGWLSTGAGMDRGGKPFFRRGEQSGEGLDRGHVERIVHQTIREANLVTGFPHVEVHQDVSTLPEHIKSLIEQQGAERLTGAVYDPRTGRIHLIASNNGTEDEVRENLWHEAVGHHGLRMAMDRPQYNAVMDGIARDMPERVEAAARRNSLDLNDLAQKRAAAEEVIAYAAGQQLSGQEIDKPVLPYWKRAVRAVKAFFARMTGKPFYDDRAIAGLIQQAHAALERGAPGTLPGEPSRSTRAPTFYSPVERAIADSKQGKASPEQWLATIKKAAGIKPDELEWLDLEPWLKAHTGPVTKQELADYVRANKLDIQETLHGGGGEDGEQTPDERLQTRLAEEIRAQGHGVDFDPMGNLESVNVRVSDEPDDVDGNNFEVYAMHDPQDREAIPEQIRDRVRSLDEVSQRVAAERQRRLGAPAGWATVGGESGPRYSEYTLSGGQNYRELLLRLPERPFTPQDLAKRKEVFDRYRQKTEELNARATNYAFSLATREEAQRQLQAVQAMRDAEADHVSREQSTYKSSHWHEKNIVAHTRFNERTDPDGKKVLFIEEVQSDWHQAGRERGYAKLDEQGRPPLPEGWIVRPPDEENPQWRMLADDGIETSWQFKADTEEELWRQADSHLRKVMTGPTGGVPDAPFKTSWPMLVMKRMIRWGAENGFDRMAWTTGAQQAERYNLAHQVEVLSAERASNASGKSAYWLNARYNEGGNIPGFDRLFHEDELEGLLGRDLAAKIKEQAEGRQEYRGLDLQVGGEGMRGFYDDILPRETGKLIKKYGGKVEDKRLVDTSNSAYADRNDVFNPEDARVVERSPTAFQVWGNGRLYGGNHPTREAAEVFRQSGGTTPVHGFDITPEMRQAALGEGFPMFARRQQSLPLQQLKGSAYDRVRRAVEYVAKENPVSRDVRKLANPTGMSQESRRVAQIAREALGELAHETVKTQEALEEFSRLIDRIPVEDQLRMMDEIERGVPQSIPEYQPVADEMRKMLDTWRGKVQGLGEGYLDTFIENYFPHYWRRQDEAQRMVASIMGRRPLRGPASFLKMRTIPSIKEGMDAGLTPLTTNPLIMTLLKTREMQRFVTGVTLMRRFKEDGLAQFLPAGKPMPAGWAPINDNIAKVRQWSEIEGGFIERGQYIMPVDAARVINNHVSASALRDFAPAQIIRRGANALNAMQLGFSAFHLGFTTLDAMISKNAQGLERLMHGEVGKAAQSFAEGLTPVGAFTNVRRGYKLLQAYSDPAGATPEMQKLVRMLEMAGGRAHMDRYYQAAEGVSPFRGVGLRSLANDVRQALTAPQDKVANLGRALGQFPIEYANKLWKGMKEIWATTPVMEVPVEMAMRVVRASTAWIMEHLVPMQKLGVFSDLAADHLRRNPIEDPNTRAAAMQKIWDSVDNRLGEMVYDNLFWNRTLKDSLHLGIRAVGWNVGTVREIAGAPVDIVKAVDKAIRTGKITADDLGHRIPYVISMAVTTALYSAIYQYMATGQPPQELKDYFFPRTGGTTNYGTPERVSLPSYVKDVYEYSQRPGTTVVNKLNPIFSVMGALWNNQDFFGNPITDPEAGYWQQKWQQLQYVGKESTPFSLQGRQQLQATDKDTGFGASVKKALPMIGVTPAPGYITSPDQMERRKRLEDDQKYTGELKYQIKKALQQGDKAHAAELTKEYTEAVKRMAETKKLVGQDKAKAAAARRKAAITMRQSGYPATADLVASLPLEPDAAARQYFAQLS